MNTFGKITGTAQGLLRCEKVKKNIKCDSSAHNHFLIKESMKSLEANVSQKEELH